MDQVHTLVACAGAAYEALNLELDLEKNQELDLAKK